MLPSLNRQSSISSQWSFSCDQEQRDDSQLGPRGSEFYPVRRAAAVSTMNIILIADDKAVKH